MDVQPAGSPVLEADVRLWQNEDCGFAPLSLTSKPRISWEGEVGLIWIWMISPPGKAKEAEHERIQQPSQMPVCSLVLLTCEPSVVEKLVSI